MYTSSKGKTGTKMNNKSKISIPKLLIIFTVVIGIPGYIIIHFLDEGTKTEKAIAIAMIPVLLGVSLFTTRTLLRANTHSSAIENSNDIKEIIELVINKRESVFITAFIVVSFWVTLFIARLYI